MADAPPLRPSLPLAQRLNRNALVVGAVVLGMTALTVVVVVHPSREAAAPRSAPAAEAGPPVTSRPAFLDQPPRVPPAAETSAVLVPRTGHEGRGPGVGADTASPAPMPMAVGPALSPRDRAYRAALASPAVLVESAPAPAMGPLPVQTDTTPLAAQEQQLVSLGDSVLRAAGGPSTGGAPATAAPADRRLHAAFLAGVGTAPRASLTPAVDSAGSPYTLRAGTVIPGVLLTAINSDLPGDIVGQVSRDVYDSRTELLVLIPKGARLLGTYDNQVAAGENRLLVAWTRLIFPDGRSLRLPGLALKDLEGQTGAKDQVDTHWRRAFGNALLLSAISAGVQLSQPQQTSVLAAPSAGQVAAGALGQELSNVALEILRRGMDAAPTITIRQGQPFNVFLNGDLVFGEPYADAPSAVR